MQIDFIEQSLADREIFNRFVTKSETGSFLQSWEWGQWQEKLGRKVWRFVLKDANNIIASIQLIRIPLFFGRYYLYAPYGPVSDLGLRAEQSKYLLQALEEKFSDALFFRIEPKKRSLIPDLPSIVKTSNIQPGKTLIIDLKKSEQQLLEQMHQKTRYNIRVAQKHGVVIKDEFTVSVGHGLFFDEALKLIIETSSRQKFNTFSAGYYREMVDFFALNSQSEIHLHIYKAIYNNQLLSVAIIIDFGHTRTFLFGGSSATNKNVMASYLMQFRALLDAKALGFEAYDFWGIETSSGQMPGFVRFKMGFTSQVDLESESVGEKTYSGAYDVICKPFWYQLYRVARKVRKSV